MTTLHLKKLITIAAISLSTMATSFASANELSDVKPEQIRAKLFCSNLDSDGNYVREINKNIASLNGKIISVSAPGLSPYASRTSQGSACVVITYKVELQFLQVDK
jgi:hypothetical protein